MANIIEIIIKTVGGKEAGAEINLAGQAMGMLTKAGAALGVGLGAREMVLFTEESMDLARAQKDARNALTMTLGSATAYSAAIKDARETTRGMVSEAGLASNINTVMAMGLAKNAQEAAQLAQAGTILGNVFASSGGSVEKYFMLLSGGSDLLLNNFGLTRNVVAARRAEIEATTALTGEEAKLQAIKDLTLASAQKYNATLSDETVQSAQTQAATEDLKAAWGDLVSVMVYGSGVAGDIADALRWLEERLEGAKAATETTDASIIAATKTYGEYQNAMIMTGQQAQMMTKAEYDAAMANIKAATATGDYDRETGLLSARMSSYRAAQAAATAVMVAHASWATTAAAVQKKLGDEYLTSRDKLAQYVNELARAQIYGSFTPAMNVSTDWQTFQDQLNAERIGRENDAQKELQRIQLDAAKDTADKLRSAIESAIQPTLPEVWKPPEADTSRMDENARRLATVATSGFGSEWLAQLDAQFQGMSFWQPIADAMAAGDEGALKEAATQILTGPDVSKLWDIELIKQKVREQLQAENVRQQLIDTIQQELAAEGTAATTAQVGAALGVEGEAEPQGMDMSSIAGQIAGGLSAALPDALKDLTMGSTLIDSIREQVKADEKSMKLLATALADRLDDYLPGAIGVTATTFLDALTSHVAARLGYSTEIRP